MYVKGTVGERSSAMEKATNHSKKERIDLLNTPHRENTYARIQLYYAMILLFTLFLYLPYFFSLSSLQSLKGPKASAGE